MRFDTKALLTKALLALASVTWAIMLGCATGTPLGEAAGTGAGEFEAAVDRDPTADTLYRMARLLQAQHRDAEAEQVLRETVARHPKFFPAYGDLAALELVHERTGDAIKTLMNGLEHFPAEPTLLNNLGMCWFAAGKHEQALDCFTRAAAASPHERRYRANLAAALAMLGRYPESLATYLQVLAPDKAHHNLAILCEARGDTERAHTEFEIAGGEAGTVP